jgi:hypothetical protein
MVKQGDTIKDIITYIGCRIEHLQLERKRAPEVNSKKNIQKALDTLGAKLEELQNIKVILNGDIKEASKKEWRICEELRQKSEE